MLHAQGGKASAGVWWRRVSREFLPERQDAAGCEVLNRDRVMGLEDRDYIRESRPRSRSGYGGGSGPHLWAVKYLLIANIAVFVLQILTRQPGQPQLVGGITGWFSLHVNNLINPADPLRGFQFWRLITYGFCHGSFEHILFNLFVLWMFGRLVEPIYGSREFLLFYLAGVFVAGLCHVTVQLFDRQMPGVIGASGGVMAVVFLTAMLFPRLKVLLFFFIPVELRVLAVLYAAVDIIGALSPGSPVAHFAHLGGAAFGVAYHRFGWRLSRWWDFLTQRKIGWRRRPKLRIHRSADEASREEIEDRVDRLLEKISRQGEASLTEAEREFLADASRRYRRS